MRYKIQQKKNTWYNFILTLYSAFQRQNIFQYFIQHRVLDKIILQYAIRNTFVYLCILMTLLYKARFYPTC